ncbi:GIY-YIG nuclease family protein [Asticcacaulis sp.]|uniref:GIY-YIG nuclease family protein n=1 Tax=Asticcacaulis sp. TaxID=1872648 RepID=UPI002D7F7433|nr:GIY-YIG nuclease family protein [Asticcacaulis sp.]
MKSEARKVAIAAYKERKSNAGIYAVRCTASDAVWVGHWSDVETIRTRMWFTLRLGTYPNKAVQDAWRSHGEAQFSFEVLERIAEEATPYLLTAKLKDRADHWRATLLAHPI